MKVKLMFWGSLFSIAALAFSCSSDDDNDMMSPTGATCSDGIMNQDETGIDCGGATCAPCNPNSAQIFASGTINGTSFQMSTGAGTNVVNYRSVSESINNGLFHTQEMVFENTSTGEQLNIGLGKFYNDGNANTMERDSLFDVGVRGYSQIVPLPNTFIQLDGAIIKYRDPGGTFWNTTSGVQPGSVFEITSRTPFVNQFAAITVEGSFTCILYDIDGNSIELTNMSFRSKAGAYL